MRAEIRALVLVAVVALAVAATITGAASAFRGGPDDVRATEVAGRVAASSAAGVAPGTPKAARAVLAGWDERRSAAWARGDTDALAALYADGSTAGEADVEMLQAWVDRGLRVEELHTQVLDFVLVSSTRGELVLDVTDRMVGGVAVGTGHRERLPVDRADQRRITMVLVEGEWRVSTVR